MFILNLNVKWWYYKPTMLMEDLIWLVSSGFFYRILLIFLAALLAFGIERINCGISRNRWNRTKMVKFVYVGKVTLMGVFLALRFGDFAVTIFHFGWCFTSILRSASPSLNWIVQTWNGSGNRIELWRPSQILDLNCDI